MATKSKYQLPSDKDDLPQIARLLRETRQGKINVVSDIVIKSGTTTTIVYDRDIGPSTVPILIPQSAAGAALTWWLAARGKGAITIGHADPGADIMFYIVMIG